MNRVQRFAVKLLGLIPVIEAVIVVEHRHEALENGTLSEYKYLKEEIEKLQTELRLAVAKLNDINTLVGIHTDRIDQAQEAIVIERTVRRTVIEELRDDVALLKKVRFESWPAYRVPAEIAADKVKNPGGVAQTIMDRLKAEAALRPAGKVTGEYLNVIDDGDLYTTSIHRSRVTAGDEGNEVTQQKPG